MNGVAGTIDSFRAKELLDETANRLRVVVAGNSRRQLTPMHLEVRRHIDEAAVLFQQIGEVQCPLLTFFELRHQDRENRPAENPGLELRARIQPDNGGTVMHRVEECRVGVHRLRQGNSHTGIGHLEAFPGLLLPGMRPDQDVARAQ